MAAAKNSDGTVGKALSVLDKVALFGRPVRFSEILADSEFPKATLYRLLQTLTNQGMLGYDPDRQLYSLGVRLVGLAHAAWNQASLAPIARPLLDELSLKVDETVHLGQLDHGQVLYVDKRNPKLPLNMFSDAGKIGPGYCTGVGKAMLAYLDKPLRDKLVSQQSFHRYTEHTITNSDDFQAELATIREQRVAYDREEHEPNIICIAAPILSSKQRVLGGLSITTSTGRYTLEELEKFKPELLATAHKISQLAQSWHFPETNS
ncbi:MAG: IclR family transcriptional regulator [Oceanospirillaceae bacterium]|nr:IclR family transcriptional regulator [Oceanospirillaceae bacterium]